MMQDLRWLSPEPPAEPDALRILLASECGLLLAGLHAALRADGLVVGATMRTTALQPHHLRAARAHATLIAPIEGMTSDLQERLRRARFPGLVVLLTGAALKVHAETLRRDGDVICLPLSTPPADVCGALRVAAAAGGDGLISTQEVLVGMGGRLTPREQQVLAVLAQGNSNREIAASLWIGEETVKAHLTRVFRKLGVTSRTEAIAAYLGT